MHDSRETVHKLKKPSRRIGVHLTSPWYGTFLCFLMCVGLFPLRVASELERARWFTSLEEVQLFLLCRLVRPIEALHNIDSTVSRNCDWCDRLIVKPLIDSRRPKKLTLLNLLFKLICHFVELISDCSVIYVFNRIVKKKERKGILKWWTVSLRWQTKSSWRYQNKYHYEQYISNCSCWWLISFQCLFGRITVK